MHKKVTQALTEQLDAIEQALVDARDALQFDIGGNFVPDLTKAAEVMKVQSGLLFESVQELKNAFNAD